MARPDSAGSWKSAALGLALTPILVGTAAVLAPGFAMSDALANFVAFAGAAGTAVAALAVAASSYPRAAWRAGVLSIAVAALVLFAMIGVPSALAVIAVDTALVAAAWAIGTSIGRRIEHPGHLLPACVVVACADAASVVSQFGPTHAVAESERALSVVAIAYPVPGTAAVAPALGVGDLVFVALLLGAVAAHGLSLRRAAVLCAVGIAVAGTASGVLETAVPALVPIAGAVVLGLPEARKMRPRERRAARVAMAIAVSAALAVIASQLVHG